jgi:hypothetical protein
MFWCTNPDLYRSYQILLVAYSQKNASYTDEDENTWYFLSDFNVFIRQEAVTFYDGI